MLVSHLALLLNSSHCCSTCVVDIRCWQEYLEASGIPCTGLRTCAFYDNFAKLFMYQRQPDGSRTWSDNLGTAPLQMHAVADIGESAACAHLLLLVPDGTICLFVSLPGWSTGVSWKRHWLLRVTSQVHASV